MNPDLHLVQGRIVPRRQFPLLAILASAALLCFPPVIIEDWYTGDHARHLASSAQRFIPVWQWSQGAGDFTVRADWPRLLILLALANVAALAIPRAWAVLRKLDYWGANATFAYLAIFLAFAFWCDTKYAASPPTANLPSPSPPTPPVEDVNFDNTAKQPPFDPDAFLRKVEAAEAAKKNAAR